MKVIFLDIDGVICLKRKIHQPSLSFIIQLIQISNSKVVLSSTWRLFGEQKIKINQLLCNGGCDGIYSCTEDSNKGRQHEILDWLNNFSKKQDKIITNWIAIDDIKLNTGSYKNKFNKHFIHVNENNGFTEDNLKEAIETLK